MHLSNNFHLLDIKTRQELCECDGRNRKCAECKKLSFVSKDKVNYHHFKTWCNEKLSCIYGMGSSDISDNFFEKDYTPQIKSIWK